MSQTKPDDSLRFSRDPDGLFVLESKLHLASPREKVFPFFADASNLQELTPPWLSFQILTPSPIEMKQGTLIDYRIRLKIIPMIWRTCITAWEPPFRFVDEQLRGPYSTWIHEHRFEQTIKGTLCHDRVRYNMPMAWMVHSTLVKPDLRRIFSFRRQKLIELFGEA